MKKFLLTFSLLALCFGVSNALTLSTLHFGEGTEQPKVQNYSSTYDVTCGGYTWSVSQFNNNNNGWDFIRCGTKNNASTPSISTSFLMEGSVEEIVITGKLNAANSGKVTSAKINVYNSTDFSETSLVSSVNIDVAKFEGAKGDEFSVSVPIPEPAIGRAYEIIWDISKLSANGLIDISKVEYNGTSGGSGNTVSAPQLIMEKTDAGYFVSMTCNTPDASIFYTMGSESPATPDKSSTLYSEPVKVSVTTYFKAIAYVGDEASYVASFTANPPYVCADFEGMTELNNGTKVELDGTVYGVYQNGSNLYVVDTKGNGMLLFGNSSKVVNNGDAIDGLEGTYSLYLGLPEIKDYTLGAISAGSPIEPTLVTLSDINDNILNKYVKLNGLKITGSGKNFVVENASGETMNLYDNFSISVQEGENFTLVGFVGKRDTDLQLLPTEITGGIVMETVATPVFEPGSGELEANKEIVISCETEGATIYYTTDKSNPSVESTKYTEPIIFTEAMTVKAIAVKEGMLDSEIAEAVYTLYDPNGPQLRTVTFDFTDPAHFGLELPVPGSGKGTDLCDAGESFEFTEDNVTLTITANDSGTLPRIWAKNSNGTVVYDLRVYVGDIISFKADKENESIKMVEFDQNTGATTWNSENTYSPDTFDSSNKIWNGEQDAETMDEFKMVAGGGNFIAKAIVTLSTVSKVTDIEYSNDAPEVFYNLQGVRVAQPTSGLYIVVKGNKSKKVMF